MLLDLKDGSLGRTWVKENRKLLVENKVLWEVPSRYPPLTKGQIIVWLISLGDFLYESKDFEALLSKDETLRASSMPDALEKERFFICRGIVRIILGHYSEQCKPGELKFAYGPNNKPSLVQDNGRGGKIHFSISHSRGLALCAISLDHEVGIDLEFKKDFNEMQRFVFRFFSEKERRKFCSLRDINKKLDFFYEHWTAKEAYLKTLGQGVGSSLLDQIETRFDNSRHLVGLDQGDGVLFALYRLRIPSFAAALVVSESVSSVFCYQWDMREHQIQARGLRE